MSSDVFSIAPGSDPRPEDIPSFRWPELSPFAREMKSWETRNRIPGYDPKQHQFPMMVCRATRKTDKDGNVTGKLMVADPYDDTFTARNTRTVKNEQELQQALSEGWSLGPDEAMKRAERDEDSVSTAAAHRHYEDRKLSDVAQLEAKEADEAAGLDHLPEVPEKPKARRGRPRKVQEPAA